VRIESTFLGSKVGRRILQLFILAAMLPVGLLAGISFWRVGQQLRAQERQSLRSASHDEGMAICERLRFIEADLRLLAAETRDQGAASVKVEPATNLSRHFKRLEFIDGHGVSTALFGDQSWPFLTSDEERAHLRSGKPLVATRPCNDSETCVFMAIAADASHPENGLLVGRVLPAYLLDKDNLPENKEVCVLDAQGQLLMCSGKAPAELPATTSRAASGQIEWRREGEAYDSDYWKVFLKPVFLTDHWTVIASESQENGLMPLAEFKRIFLLVVSLTVLIVALLSLIQIRRQMVPLGQLQEGTRRIAQAGFDTRVDVKSGDEFEELAHSFNSMAERIEKQFHTLQTNSRIDRAILSSLEIEEIVATLAAQLRSVLPYEAACISFFEAEDSNRAKSYISWENGRKNETSFATLKEEEIQELSMDHQVGTVSAGRSTPGFLEPLASRGMRFFLVAPVVVRGRAAAIISLGHSSHAIWAQEEQAEAQQIADRVAVAVANARLVDDLKRTHTGMLAALARAIDAKSHWTAGHSERVTNMALRIAMAMGLPAPDLDILWRGGLLHDIGKIGIDAEILDKPGRLTPEEMAQVREHVEIGRRIIEPIPGFRDCLPVVMHHHEKFDGSGYPYGLAGEDISLHGRIFAVADCFDAVVSDRPYRPSLGTERAIEIIRQGAGTHFDPRIVEIFLRITSSDGKPPHFRESAEALAPSLSAI
jgi:putative nucleotidyltransferase with HDIG domain